MKSFKGTTALITGASSGIGEAFARTLAARQANLILIARSEDKLHKLAEALSEEHGVAVHVFPGDLSLEDTPQRLYDQVKDKGLSVDILINNAGFGKWGHFLAEDYKTYQEMLRLNINSLVGLTYLFIPEMIKKRTGGVINVASTAAFQPVPYIATYSASKAFVLSFSEALYGEFKNQGITILALCPGYTSTNFFADAHADTSGVSFETPEKVADAGLNAFLKGRNYHISGTSNYIQSILPRILPRCLAIKVVGNMFRTRVAPIKSNGRNVKCL